MFSLLTSVIYSLDFIIQPHIQKSHIKKSTFSPKHSSDIQKSNGKAFLLTCQWFSFLRGGIAPRVHLAMSGDIFGCHNSGKVLLASSG